MRRPAFLLGLLLALPLSAQSTAPAPGGAGLAPTPSAMAATARLAPPATASGAAAAAADAVLEPGDSVRLTVWRRPELTGEFVVAADGSLAHPLFRGVRVGGVSTAVAEANVRALLTQFDQVPQFVLEPLIRVAVLGEVNQPKLYAMRPGTTVSEAVSRAGGPTQFAKSNHVRVLHTQGPAAGQEIMVDLTRLSPGAGEPVVRSGDRILVERRSTFFRDVLVPTVTVVGGLASIGIFIDRNTK